MTFSLYSAQLFRYDGAVSHSPGKRIISQDNRVMCTLNSEMVQVMLMRNFWRIGRKVFHFPVFLHQEGICLLHTVGKKTAPSIMVLPAIQRFLFIWISEFIWAEQDTPESKNLSRLIRMLLYNCLASRQLLVFGFHWLSQCSPVDWFPAVIHPAKHKALILYHHTLS